MHPAFEHGADDLGDGSLKTFRRVDRREVALARRIERGVVEAAVLAQAERGLRAAASADEDVVAAGSLVSFLVISVRVSTLPPCAGEWNQWFSGGKPGYPKSLAGRSQESQESLGI